MQHRLTARILDAKMGVGVDILQVVDLAVLGGVGVGLDLVDGVGVTFIESIDTDAGNTGGNSEAVNMVTQGDLIQKKPQKRERKGGNRGASRHGAACGVCESVK